MVDVFVGHTKDPREPVTGKRITMWTLNGPPSQMMVVVSVPKAYRYIERTVDELWSWREMTAGSKLDRSGTLQKVWAPRGYSRVHLHRPMGCGWVPYKQGVTKTMCMQRHWTRGL